MINQQSIRDQYPVTQSAIYFNHAAAGPISLKVKEAMAAVTEDQARFGVIHHSDWVQRYGRVRGQLARLVGSAPEHISFSQNTSHGLSIAANGLSFASGDNVVVPAVEFPSNYYPWLNLEQHGVEMRRVPAPLGYATASDIANLIDRRTRLVAVSFVQFSNGYRYDLAAISEICAKHNVLLVVDGTQGVGALVLDVDGIDVLAVSAHKWMLGPLGIGFVHFSDKAMEALHPATVGWLSVEKPFAFDYEMKLSTDASRFEPGTENAAGLCGLGGTLDLMEELTPKWIESRVLSLTDYLCEGLARKGYEVTSARNGRQRSGIIVFRSPRYNPQDLLTRLTEAAVQCSARGGGIRFSPHYYNNEAEVDAALEVLL